MSSNTWIAGGLVLVGLLLVTWGGLSLLGADGDTPTPTTAPVAVATSQPAGTEQVAVPATPTTVVTPTTTTAPTTTSTTTTTTTLIIQETPEEFLELLVTGLQSDPELLVSRLNQATIDIYGADQCLDTLGQVLDPETMMTIREVGEVGPWDYVIDDITTPLQDVLAVEIERFVAGQTLIQEIHWKQVNGLWTWFSDCGDPLQG